MIEVALRVPGLGRHRRADVADPGPDRGLADHGHDPAVGRPAQPDPGRPHRPVDRRPDGAGESQPQHPVRRDDAARPGRRDIPARPADGARTERRPGDSIDQPAILVLEDGRTFHGEAYGAVGETFGEAVFTTGMTGYQETLTDPSYHRQVVVQTAPHIGNTGVNDEDDESDRIWVAGYVVRDPVRGVQLAGHRIARRTGWRPRASSASAGIDTRALTRHLRERGAMRVGVSSVDCDPAGAAGAGAAPSRAMVGADLSAEVTTPKPYVVAAEGEHRFTVAALDLGIKRNVARRLAARGVTTHVLPATSTIEDLLATGADAVFFSPGPGDPATADARRSAWPGRCCGRRIPLFGICFGSQILGRALGFGTYKLGYGHRGINQPVLDRATGKVEVTCHNHGFAVGWPGRDRGRVRSAGRAANRGRVRSAGRAANRASAVTPVDR